MSKEKKLTQSFLINPLIFDNEGEQEQEKETETEQPPKSTPKLINPLHFFKEGSQEAKIYEERLKRLLTGKAIKPFTIEGEDDANHQEHQSDFARNTGFSQSQIAVRENVSMVKAQEHSKLLDFPIDDTGNVGRVFMVSGEIILYNSNNNKFYIWNGKVWELDEIRQVKKICEKVMKRYREAAEPYRHSGDDHLQECFRHSQHSCNNGRLNALVEMLKHRTAIISEKLDSHPHLLNVKNGVVDLHTGYLQGHEKDLLLTQLVNVDYVSNAYTHSLFGSFVLSICGGDQQFAEYLQKLFGYIITGETKEQILILIVGGGSNGKTTFLEAVGRVIHEFVYRLPIAVLLDSSIQAGRPSPELAQAVNARALLCSESNEGDYLNEGKVKMLTGETTISVRNLYCEPFEFRPKFKIVMDTNHLPKIKGRDHAIWRRLRVVPFTQTFKGKNRDKYLAQKLKSFQEQRAILAWLVEGAVRYYQEGLGDIPAIADATAAYQQRFDTIQGFLKEGVEYGKSFACAGVEIYEAYKAFCAAKELEPENNTNFGMALVENGVEKVRTSDGMRYKGIKPKIM